MNLLDVLRPECVRVGVDAGTKEAVLNAVVEAAQASPLLGGMTHETLSRGLHERESLGSTGFGHGIAIPHCRVEGIEGFVVGIFTLKEGAEYESLDGMPVRLVAFIIAPLEQSDEHIRLLSAISQTLKVPGAMDELLAAPTPESLLESFARHTRDDLETKDYQSKNLIQVFVQEDERFRELLEIFAAIDPDRVTVLEAQGTGAYLSRMPLFAGFWSDQDSQSVQVIVAAVEKRLTNETIRRIESVTGHLDECHDVMVTVHELSYCAGGMHA